jgi:molecular chaperone GrpE (heat shock protein)
MTDVSTPSRDSTQLQAWMTAANISSFKALSRTAAVTEWQVRLLKNGKIQQMRIEPLQKISQALGIRLTQLLESVLDESWHQSEQAIAPSLNSSSTQPSIQPSIQPSTQPEESQRITQLQQEYDRLQRQLEQQRDQLRTQFQQASLRILEPWMIHFPTAAYHAQQQPDLPATKLIPLVRPVEQLLKSWGVEAIAPIGTELPYEPQWHQLREGSAQSGELQPGDLVCVRNAGYRQGEKLLHRAKVSPVKN